MMTHPHYHRREVLRVACGLAAGSLFGNPVVSMAAPRVPQTLHDLQQQGRLPTHALSLTQLQRTLAQQTLSEQHRRLEGLTAIHGVMIEPDGDIIVLGSKEEDTPYELDTLVQGLRNTFGVEPEYARTSLGVTIDPWEDADDPWRIQKVKVLGMASDIMLAKRFVDLDYELKAVSAGLLVLAPQVESVYAKRQTIHSLCERHDDSESSQPVVHRFWFTSRYPSKPRFLKQGQDLVLILKPVGVQLLTEREYRDARGKRQRTSAATSEAAAFAREVSGLLDSAAAPERYRMLVKDFQLIEVAELLRFLGLTPSRLDYFLWRYPLTRVKVPSYVGGMRREATEEAVCQAEIVERRTPQGIEVSSKERIARRQHVSRGGIEARVQLPAQHFETAPSRMVKLIQQYIRRSRPSPHALQWAIQP